MEFLGIFLAVLGLGFTLVLPFASENADELCVRLINFWVRILPKDSREYWAESWIAENEHIKQEDMRRGTSRNLTRLYMAIDLGRFAIGELVSYNARPFSKRAFDLMIGGSALIFVMPLILFISAAVRLQDGGSPFYIQKRRGKDGQTIDCFKIRSMYLDADRRLEKHLNSNPVAMDEWINFQKLSHDPRISPLGHFIRKTAIDELPQLFNVVRGDMSIVGPRPISKSDEEQYGENLAFYDKVRPGITGLWQINSPLGASISDRVRRDIEYVKDQSFLLDLSIIIRTIPAVLMDVNEEPGSKANTEDTGKS